jgi:hypothetical protein
MIRKLAIAFAAAARAASTAGAFAQSAPAPQPAAATATTTPLSPALKRLGRPATAAPSHMPGAGFSALTAEECTKLGGKVYTAPQCKKTGTRCVVHLPGGQINAPCIDEVS